MKVTTVKVSAATKKVLDAIKRGDESYDALLQRLARREKAENLRARMIEGAKNQARADPRWEKIDADWPDY